MVTPEEQQLASLRAENAALRERLANQIRIASYQMERFDFLARAMPQQLWTSHPTGQLDYVNVRVTEFFGRTAEQVIGDGWKDYLHPDDLESCVRHWTHSLQTGAPYEVEFRLRRADGVYRWHLARAVAQTDASGKIVRWYGTNTDITELKAAIGGTAR